MIVITLPVVLGGAKVQRDVLRRQLTALRARLAIHKVPRVIEFVDTLDVIP